MCSPASTEFLPSKAVPREATVFTLFVSLLKDYQQSSLGEQAFRLERAFEMLKFAQAKRSFWAPKQLFASLESGDSNSDKLTFVRARSAVPPEGPLEPRPGGSEGDDRAKLGPYS